MASCTKCSATLTEGSSFCGSCGNPVASPQATSSGPQVVTATPVVSGSGLTSNVAGALAYVLGLITGVVFLVLEPYKRDRFVRFHAMQSILFCVAAIAFSIAWSILVDIMINLSGWTAVALTPIGLVISLGFFLFWLFLMYQAYSQREFRIPVIGAIAAKQVG
ncbi:MAG: hypothetical protein WA485_20300 [Candidatus Sulfotelmatobacter sp.]